MLGFMSLFPEATFTQHGVEFEIYTSDTPFTGGLKFSLHAMHGELEAFIGDYPTMTAAKKVAKERASELLAKFVAHAGEAA